LSCDKVARKADRVSDAIAEILRQRDHPVVELQVDETFMRGLTRSLVAVPFVTADALARMCEPDSEQRIDHVLAGTRAGQGQVHHTALHPAHLLRQGK
jgi:hypothetical protein